MIVWKYCEISMKALCSSSRLAVMNVARRVGLWRAKQLSCADGGLHFASLHRTWRVKTILLYSEATKHRKPLKVKYSCLQKSGLCMCTMKPFADPRTGAECKVSPTCSYNGYNSYTAAATARVMRQLLPVCIKIPPPGMDNPHQPHALCHVSRVTCSVWSVQAVTTFNHPAPAQPAARTALQNIIKLNPIYVLRKNRKPQMKSWSCI